LLPTWSSLGFGTKSGEYTPVTAKLADIAAYRQVEDLRTGMVTTSGVWSAPGSEKTAFEYRVYTHRARKHVGVVTLALTPQWSGALHVDSLLDGAGALRLVPGEARVDTRGHISRLTARTAGTDIKVAMASVLTVSGQTPSASEAIALDRPLSAGERVTLDVQAGKTYTFTKIVGVATTKDAPDPVALVERETRAAASTDADALLAENRAAWDTIWKGDIEIAGDPRLQTVVRAGIYDLYASIRDDAPGVLGPSGLSSDSYAGMAFWDSDTWMMPALLATHPEVARTMVNYRYDTLAAARRNAKANGHAGAFYPWTAADDGSIREDCYGTVADENDKILSDPNYSCSQEFHLQADVALAAWQYFAATGDRQWLAERGFPLLSAIADFWVSVATPAPGGGYDVKNVQPPDEDHFGVNNSAYTNAAAAQALRHAMAAARLLGRPASPRWSEVADGVVRTIPFDKVNQRHLEYDGYDGATVKQADVVLMTYPLHYPMPAQVALNDLNYYVPRTRANGPAMTDAIHSIATSALDLPGCAAYTYMIRSYLPQLREPFFQTSETTEGGPMNFLTGTGGILQQFLYGFSGLRFGPDAIELDPSLPPQMAGLTLHGLRWQGRVFSMRITRASTTVTLESGQAMPVTTRAGRRTLAPGTPLTLETRNPDRQPTDNLVRCQPATATSAVAANPALAAADGSIATGWSPLGGKGALTLSLKAPTRIGAVDVTRGMGGDFSYTVEASADGRSWWPVGTQKARSASSTDRFAGPAQAAAASYLRLSVTGHADGPPPQIVDVSVTAKEAGATAK
jgi:trehalose/maltose hydrolase-like predicted phosphorylase